MTRHAISAPACLGLILMLGGVVGVALLGVIEGWR